MQVRFSRTVILLVLVGAVGAVSAGCGKYSISNIRSAKAFQDANNLYKKNDFEGAVARYEDSIRFNPELGFAYFFLGHSYENLYKPGKKGDPTNDGYLEKAAQHYRTAVDKLATATDPKEKEVRRYAFEYLMAVYGSDKLNDFTKAEPVARELIAVDPSDPTTYRILATLYVDQGRFEEAEQQFLKAIEVAPRDAAGYQFLAGFYNDKLGDFEKTIQAWNKRAEVEPNNPEAWHTIGVYYQDKVLRDKRLPNKTALEYTMKGIEAEDKALAINPEYSEALVYKGILMRHQALYERSPAMQKQLLEEAERLRDKALAIQKKQNQGAAAADAAAKKGGS